MKEFIGLLTAIVVLATALISLNKTGVIGGGDDSPSTPVSPSGGDGSNGGVVNPPPPSTKIKVPELRGMTQQQAQEKLAEVGLSVQSIEPIRPCRYEPGVVEQSGPPTGWEMTKGDDVVLFVCE